jgi:excisionase family DNA binding protein
LDPEESALTVAEVAAALRVHPNTVRRWLHTGQLRGRNLGGRSGYRVPRAEVRRFVAALAGHEGATEAEPARS